MTEPAGIEILLWPRGELPTVPAIIAAAGGNK